MPDPSQLALYFAAAVLRPASPYLRERYDGYGGYGHYGGYAGITPGTTARMTSAIGMLM